MNSYEVENLMNLSGFGDSFDFLGVDVTEFSAAEETIEEHVQSFPSLGRRNVIDELNFSEEGKEAEEIFSISKFGSLRSQNRGI